MQHLVKHAVMPAHVPSGMPPCLRTRDDTLWSQREEQAHKNPPVTAKNISALSQLSPVCVLSEADYVQLQLRAVAANHHTPRLSHMEVINTC